MKNVFFDEAQFTKNENDKNSVKCIYIFRNIHLKIK